MAKSSEKKSDTYKQFVVFRVGNHEFGVDIHQTREIITVDQLTFLPETPDFISGVINLRGEIVPVIDLQKRLNLDDSFQEEQLENKIIITEVNDNLIGIKVKDVKEIIRLQETEVESPPEIVKNIKKDYITGVGKLEKQLIIFLNLDKILSVQEVAELDDIDFDQEV